MSPKILAPAGSFEALSAAISNGADSVYFGTKLFNMRGAAKNFEVNQMGKIVDICKKAGVTSNLTLNVQIYNHELEKARSLLQAAKDAGVDAVIAWDPAVIQMAGSIGLPLHISTQASVANLESALFYEKLGAKVIVLAREMTLENIKIIKKGLIKAGSSLKIECFAHGAMCVAISGRCFLSHFSYKKSGNRGECLSPCRRSYRIIDDTSENEFRVEEHTLLSPKDLCTIPVLEPMIDAGIDIFKLEGRNRSHEYVAMVVKTYKNALLAIKEKRFDKKMQDESMADLDQIYNKGFHTGFYLGTPGGEDFAQVEYSSSSRKKVYIGRVEKVYKKISVFDLVIHTGQVNVGEVVMISGKTTGVVESPILSIHNDSQQSLPTAKKGQLVGIKLKDNIIPRPGDKIFIFRNLQDEK
jgi:U32 family peptidase